ncbi:hypothetical protein BGZ88_007301, partial [Linnemannia elongata]
VKPDAYPTKAPPPERNALSNLPRLAHPGVKLGARPATALPGAPSKVGTAKPTARNHPTMPGPPRRHELSVMFSRGMESVKLTVGFTPHSVPQFCNTLELSLESGLSQLGVLKNLEVFGFEGVDYRIKTKELSWMTESWPRLRVMRGLSNTNLLGNYEDPRMRSLKEFMKNFASVREA